MKELEYPFNSGWILENTRRIRKELLSSGQDFINKKIAVLGGSTTAHIVKTLELFLLNYGIRPEFYESDYGRFYEEAVFPNERLEKFSPDVIYIHTSNRNIKTFPALTDSKEYIDSLLESEAKKFESLWESLSCKYHCPVIQNNFELPLFRLLGNKDSSDIHGAVNYISRLNAKFYEYAQTHENFFICDINYISADYGLKEWSDPSYWYMYKYALNINAVPVLAFNVASIIKSLFGKNKKGLVLDLDNTLWGGVISEDGPENIRLGSETPEGQSYSDFQRYIKALAQMGIVLAVDSKNDMNIALEGLKHPDSLLRPEDFAVIKANWLPKDINFHEIADEINLLPESLVFIDDNPAERHIITQQIPGVSAPEISSCESHNYVRIIDHNAYFEAASLSEDDLKRNEMYRQNQARLSTMAKFNDYGEYLASLDMKALIRPFEALYISRITQLTNKTNQFNLTSKRFTQGELESIMKDRNYITLYGRLYDKFGDNGITALAIGRLESSISHVELWLMSCRVLKRNLEHAMMDEFVKSCRSLGAVKIRGYYYPTAKNSMVKDFYESMGFKFISCSNSNEDGGTVWELDINSYTNQNKYINIISRSV